MIGGHLDFLRGYGARTDRAFLPKDIRFLVDRMVGKLAKYLVMLGIDALYFTGRTIAELIELSKRHDRVILTRNARIAGLLTPGAFLLLFDDSVDEQLIQVVKHFRLRLSPEEFLRRCLRCNTRLEKMETSKVDFQVPAYIRATHQDYSSCPQCGKVYWRGSHCQRMEERLHRALRVAKEAGRR